jgi:probable phosphoglycerate mutase
MELILVRHAEPVRIDSHETNGAPADPGLTARGREQAARAAAWLAFEKIDALLVSPKLRAVETAAPIATACSLTPEEAPDLIEYDARSDHYIPIDELRASNDARFTAMVEGRWEEFGGEAPEVFQARIAGALDRIVAEHPGERVVAVCHGGVINIALALVAGLDRLLWFDPVYTSMSRIVASRAGIRSVGSINDTGHLIASRERAAS